MYWQEVCHLIGWKGKFMPTRTRIMQTAAIWLAEGVNLHGLYRQLFDLYELDYMYTVVFQCSNPNDQSMLH